MLTPAVKSLELLENFALSSWSPDTKREYQHSILQYAGELLKDARQVFKCKPLELTTLCIPVNVYNFEVKTCLNLAQVINSNAELQNVKRLQLTEVKSINEIKSALPLFSKLQSLDLYMFNDAMKIKTNVYIEMINQCNHLTELKIFGGCWTPFEAGPCAPQVLKFTMAANSLFDRFLKMLYRRDDDQNEEQNDEQVDEPDEIQVQMRGWYRGRLTFNQVANEFVKLISFKFPSLEELTILTDENTMEKAGLFSRI